MIKIDGSTIKSIREAQGLTQLYVATAVQVTTDTISRWENRRYPTIKKENGLKLAESLGVPLDDILEKENDEEICENQPPSAPNAESPLTSTGYGFKKIWPLLLLSGTLLITISAFLFYFFHSTATISFAIKRVLPPHITAGVPFPVLIHVSGKPDTSTSLIIREKLPGKATLLTTSPEASTAGSKENQIKWLKKITGNTIFAYLIQIDGEPGESVVFNGTVAIGGTKSPAPSLLEGDQSTVTGTHHWADTNTDNSISDSEILVVYEQYSDIPNIDLHIDLVEEIWLGSGYVWNATTSTFEIRD